MVVPAPSPQTLFTFAGGSASRSSKKPAATVKNEITEAATVLYQATSKKLDRLAGMEKNFSTGRSNGNNAPAKSKAIAIINNPKVRWTKLGCSGNRYGNPFAPNSIPNCFN